MINRATCAVSGGAFGATTMALCAISNPRLHRGSNDRLPIKVSTKTVRLGGPIISQLLMRCNALWRLAMPCIVVAPLAPLICKKVAGIGTCLLLLLSITLIADVSPQKGFYNPASLEVIKEYTLDGGIFAVSPEGSYIALSSGADVKIYESITGKEIAQFTGFNLPAGGTDDGVHDGVFNRTGELLAICCYDQTVRVFNIKQKEQIADFNIPTQLFACSVAFSYDNKYIAAPEVNTGIIFIWDLAEKKLATQITGDFNTGISVSFDPSGKFLVASCADQTLSVFNIESKSKVKSLLTSSDQRFYVPKVDFTKDGKKMLTSDPEGKIMIFDANKWEVVESHETSRGIRWSCFDETARFGAFACNNDGEVQIMNLNTKEIVKKVKIEAGASENPCARVAFTKYNKNIIIGQYRGKVIVLGRKD